MTAGYILLNKDPGQSSFEALGPVKKALATGKVCHTGTLDKFARGLLVVLAGRGVKLASWFSRCDKRYLARIKFGEETTTLDPEGTVIARAPVPQGRALEEILPRFTGALLQSPPPYSAVHVNGERAYKLARAGVQVEMKPRPVTVYSLRLLSWDPPLGELEVHCSKGTYIRSLARDMALALSSRAHLTALTRTGVGNFSLEGAVPSGADPDSIRAALAPLDPRLFTALDIPSLSVDGETARELSQGKPLQSLRGLNFPPDTDALALFGPRSFSALIEKKEQGWQYGYVNVQD
ncbi:MAG: tRNA pseudouridine(55) synthase TruB [Spirochaetaceae bacterium]|jgi:tRNA pseudouridine55 synthase|nr:tRNA pseudouridine(55) synthase TruB [Spirochaetaceae bacterium]